jgi:hypothetical protein
MNWYRVYFLNEQRRVCDVAEYRSASDETALQRGLSLLKNRPYFHAFELWHDARPVFVYPCDGFAEPSLGTIVSSERDAAARVDALAGGDIAAPVMANAAVRR